MQMGATQTDGSCEIMQGQLEYTQFLYIVSCRGAVFSWMCILFVQILT